MSEIAFPTEGIILLRNLAANNDRPWFAAHKPEIEAHVLRPAHELLDYLAGQLEEKFGGTFQGKVYRIHRDVRFSKDKTPYTPYVRLSLSRTGEECQRSAAFHYSFEADRYIVGAGIWEFSSESLARFREALFMPPRSGYLDEVLKGLEAQGARISEPELARMPKGIPPGGDPIHMRRKGLTAWIETPFLESLPPVRRDDILKRTGELGPLFEWLSTV